MGSAKNAVLRVTEPVLTRAIRIYSSLKSTVSRYTTPIVDEMLALYQKIGSRMAKLCGPGLEKIQGYTSTMRAVFEDIAVAIKVRAASARELTRKYSSACYIKIEGNVVSMYGIVGEKVLCIKVGVSALLSKMSANIAKFGNDASMHLSAANENIQTKMLGVSESVKQTAGRISSSVKVTVNDREVQATAAGAVGGATAVGATGGATGLTIGAACGLPAAPFTLGLSIPIGAMIGGTTGFVAGAAVGFIGGGAAGRVAYRHRDEIRSGVATVTDKANGYTSSMKNKVDMKAKLVGGKH